jgi:hypothetical protein
MPEQLAEAAHAAARSNRPGVDVAAMLFACEATFNFPTKVK